MLIKFTVNLHLFAGGSTTSMFLCKEKNNEWGLCCSYYAADLTSFLRAVGARDASGKQTHWSPSWWSSPRWPSKGQARLWARQQASVPPAKRARKPQPQGATGREIQWWFHLIHVLGLCKALTQPTPAPPVNADPILTLSYLGPPISSLPSLRILHICLGYGEHKVSSSHLKFVSNSH